MSTQPKEDRMVKSTDDTRILNNAARHQYRILSPVEKQQMVEIKDKGVEFLALCDKIGAGREMSLAKTKIEEAVMWAVKHVTR